MRLSVEHLTNDMLMLYNGHNVVAIVELLHSEVIVVPRASERCFLIMPGFGNFSMSAHPDRDQIKLEVDALPRAIVHLRADNIAVCFHGSDMFSIQIL